MIRRLVVIIAICCSIAMAADSGQRAPTTAEIRAVNQAIVDEIYDYDRASQFAYIGIPVKNGSVVRLIVYFSRITGETGQVIYKYMPFGEVIRRFALRADGTAELFGDSSLRFPFPATQPDTRTVYMDDNALCHMKNTWQKAAVDVTLKPDESTLMAAAKRQQTRTGFSFQLDRNKSKQSQ
jgi:hypothetical protein